MNNAAKSFFTENLLKWDANENKREMPWKREKDPYKIWLSEIILQQTRVEQGWAYYNRFIQQYPDIKKLAAAPEKDVFKLWEGLGYYTRCRNLIATAKYITAELNGIFPATYDDILQLKGIGAYTAAAIASFAYNLPYAVVDGNVMRVLARYFGIETAIDSTEGKKEFSRLAQQLLKVGLAGKYNQAIMDFGATICKPQQPLCLQCPLAKKCIAYRQQIVNNLPVKSKKLLKKNRWFYYLLIEKSDHFLIRIRDKKDIWQQLHEFVLIENDKALSLEELVELPAVKKLVGKNAVLQHVSVKHKQQLTHQTIQGFFIHYKIKKAELPEGYQFENKTTMLQLAFPRFITGYFDERKAFFEGKQQI